MKNSNPDIDSLAGTRLDVWLWAARFFKTRSLAKQAIEGGKIAIGGATATKASKLVHLEDVLVVQRGELRQRHARRLADVGHCARGARRRDERAGYQAPDTRPNKKARRLIRALGDIDAF